MLTQQGHHHQKETPATAPGTPPPEKTIATTPATPAHQQQHQQTYQKYITTKNTSDNTIINTIIYNTSTKNTSNKNISNRREQHPRSKKHQQHKVLPRTIRYYRKYYNVLQRTENQMTELHLSVNCHCVVLWLHCALQCRDSFFDWHVWMSLTGGKQLCRFVSLGCDWLQEARCVNLSVVVWVCVRW